jgi:hypothetical protein
MEWAIRQAGKATRSMGRLVAALDATRLEHTVNGWIGHNGNIMSYMVYPYYLPAERMTMVVMLNSGADIPGSWLMIQDITRIISPKNVWPGLPKGGE